MRLLVLLALGAAEVLGPPLRQEGFQLRPPRAFRMTRMDLYHGTRAGSVAPRVDTPRFLTAALMDGDGEDAAMLLLSVVESSFALGPSARDELSTATLRHFRDELGQRFVLEGADTVQGPAARVEVVGSVREGSQLRQILVAAYPGENRHVVALVSVPSGRWSELRGPIRESLDSFRVEPVLSGPPRRWRLAFAALVGALLLTSVGLWRRRRALRAAR